MAKEKIKKTRFNRQTKGEKVFNVVNIIIMILLLLIVIYPLWYVVIYSLNDAQDATKGGFFLLPRQPTFYNYWFLLKNPDIYSAFLVTFVRTIVGTVASVSFTAMVAYGLSKKDLMGRKFYLGCGIVTLVFSAGMIPSYFVIDTLGMINSFWVYIIPALFSFYNALIFMTFFRGIPPSLEESAQVDGANDFLIFARIIIPLSMPVVATIALFNGVGHYNDYFSTVMYTSDIKALHTIQYFLLQLINQNNAKGMAQHMPPSMALSAAAKTSATSLKYAAMVLTSLPIMCVYPFLQKHFVKGVMIGSVKG